MSELDARCAGCGIVLEGADLRLLIELEEEARRMHAPHTPGLLCMICWYRVSNGQDFDGNEEEPQMYSF